jgi:hypothetical protein
MIFLTYDPQHWVLSAIRIREAIRQAPQFAGNGTALYLATEGDPAAVARHAMVFVSGWILDVILVYRVYILYGESTRASLLPGLATVGSLSGFYSSMRSAAPTHHFLSHRCLRHLSAHDGQVVH